jgi:hypothetical protein
MTGHGRKTVADTSGEFPPEAMLRELSKIPQSGEPPSVTAHLTGYIRVNAESLDQAKSLLIGNPLFEAGGTVEIRELPRAD